MKWSMFRTAEDFKPRQKERLRLQMMRLSDLLKSLNYECIQGDVNREVSEICMDSRKEMRPGALFVCLSGANFDGHDYVSQVIEKGCDILVVSRPVDLCSAERGAQATVILVPDTRYALAHISAAWFGHPAEKMKMIGLTGTKGKTTTANLIKAILENAGHKVGIIGTIGVQFGDKQFATSNTTPESYLLQSYFAQMAEAGVEYVVMEVSSQALKQHRTQGFTFDIGVFTNLEADHIGPTEHADMEEYMACKGLLFRQCKVGIVNGDDSHLQSVLQGHTCALQTFGIGQQCDIRAGATRLLHNPGQLGVAFSVSGQVEMDAEITTPGQFSVYNGLCAIAVASYLGIAQEPIQKALREIKVKGRIEMVQVPGEYTLLIDYAHNAMALESLLTTLKEYQPRRLICLFGCGGNRSKSRRYEMGEISGKLADLTIITSDNPRFEEPMDIIADIKLGMAKTDGEYVEIPDRKEAIRYAMSIGSKGDIIVLAGKGHEDSQEIKGVKYPMDERVIIRDIIAEN